MVQTKLCVNCGIRPPTDKNNKCNGCKRQIRKEKYEHMNFTCSVCLVPLSLTDKMWAGNTICTNCLKSRRKQKLVDDFGGECNKCGYKGYTGVLHFHHKDSSEKYLYNRKGDGRASLKEVEEHPERFALLCANCHIEVHHLRRSDDKYTEY